MTTQRDETFASPLIRSLTIDAAIRIGLLGLFLYWSLKVMGPFLTVGLWSAILTVALYPLFDWLAVRPWQPPAGRDADYLAKLGNRHRSRDMARIWFDRQR